MSTIESLTIDGLWGDEEKHVHFDLKNDVNFLIGVNGSGKTTVINILAASLLADFSSLNKFMFKRILIKLKDDRKRPTIEIVRDYDEDSPYDEFIYKIKSASNSKIREFHLSDHPHAWSRHEYMMIHERNHRRISSKRRPYHPGMEGDDLKSTLGALVKTSWLSVHRASFYERKEGQHKKSPVDLKLEEILDELARYFSTLDKLSSKEQNNFQESVFLALLYEGKQKSKASIFQKQQEENLEDEKKHLLDIFEKFEIAPHKVKTKVDSHFKFVKKATETLEKESGLSVEDLVPLVLNRRIDIIIDEWNKFNESIDKIFEPQKTFFEVLNNLFQRKKVSVDNRNQLQIITQSGKNLHFSDLSSGEKQLLIVLVQAVLQRNEQWVYIADEPELSLHVKWQDNLVNNIRILNPNAQIIFATHSPDIVGSYSDNVHDMETKL